MLPLGRSTEAGEARVVVLVVVLVDMACEDFCACFSLRFAPLCSICRAQQHGNKGKGRRSVQRE